MAAQTLTDLLKHQKLDELALPSNYKYGRAIYQRGAVEIIESQDLFAEAWVGGLDGTVSEGGGSRRRTRLIAGEAGLSWHCAGNPKNHQIFCKHCVALALAIVTEERE